MSSVNTRVRRDTGVSLGTFACLLFSLFWGTIAILVLASVIAVVMLAAADVVISTAFTAVAVVDWEAQQFGVGAKATANARVRHNALCREVAQVKLAVLLRDGARRLGRLLSDPRLPRLVKWLLALALLPIPRPFEELAGGLASALPLGRTPSEEHWSGLRSESWFDLHSVEMAARAESVA